MFDKFYAGFFIFLVLAEKSDTIFIPAWWFDTGIVESKESIILSHNKPIKRGTGYSTKFHRPNNIIFLMDLEKLNSKLSMCTLDSSIELINNSKFAISFIPRNRYHIFMELPYFGLDLSFMQIYYKYGRKALGLFLDLLEWNCYPITIVRKYNLDFFYVLADCSPFSFLFCLHIMEVDLWSWVYICTRVKLVANT